MHYDVPPRTILYCTFTIELSMSVLLFKTKLVGDLEGSPLYFI